MINSFNLQKRKASTSILNFKKTHFFAVWALHYFVSSYKTLWPETTGKLHSPSRYAASWSWQNGTQNRTTQWANARAPSSQQQEILPKKLLSHTHFHKGWILSSSMAQLSPGPGSHKWLRPCPFGTVQIQKKRGYNFCQKLERFSLVKFIVLACTLTYNTKYNGNNRL